MWLTEGVQETLNPWFAMEVKFNVLSFRSERLYDDEVSQCFRIALVK